MYQAILWDLLSSLLAATLVAFLYSAGLTEQQKKRRRAQKAQHQQEKTQTKQKKAKCKRAQKVYGFTGSCRLLLSGHE